MQLTEKVIVVTGGAGFLGASFCSAIAEQGGIIIVADIDKDAAVRVAANISANHPGRAEAFLLNITSEISVKSLIGTLQQKHGRIDALVNNAYPRNRDYGVKLEDVSYESFCENLSLHLGGYFLTAQQFGIFFRNQGFGNIINMSSIYGTMTPRFEIYADTTMTMPVEYAAIKSGVNQLTRYLAQYYKGNNIRVNSLSPGGILGEQPDSFLNKYNAHSNFKGMLDPVDISGSLIYLLSDASRFMTGQTLVIDDGFSM